MILAYRWLIVLLFGVALIRYEVLEHSAAEGVETEFLVEVLVLGILFPMFAGLFLSEVNKTELLKAQVERRIALENELRQRFNLAKNWEELSQSIVQFPREIAPFLSQSLLLSNQAKSRLETVVEWQVPGGNIPPYPTYLPFILQEQPPGLYQIPFDQFPDLDHCEDCHGYSLPLQHGRITVGFLHLYLPRDQAILESDTRILIDLAPMLSFAIESMRPDGTELIRANASETEQRRLARYLHDTVGKNWDISS